MPRRTRLPGNRLQCPKRLVERPLRHLFVAELKLTVVVPLQCVEFGPASREALAFHVIECGPVGGIVGSHHAFPQPELHEDVRRHVQGVGGARRNLRVHPRGRQGQDRVLRIVEGVNDEVRCTRVLRIAREHLHGDGTGTHLPAEPLVTTPDGAEQGQGVERRNLVVLGVGLVQMSHRLGIGDVPGQLVAGAVEDINRFHETPLVSGRRSC